MHIGLDDLEGLSHIKVHTTYSDFYECDNRDELELLVEGKNLVENDHVTIYGEDPEAPPIALTRFRNGKLEKLKALSYHKKFFGVPLRNLEGKENIEQMYFLEDFFDPDICLQVVTGDAGTGKNFIALVAALYKALKTESGTRVIYTRDPIALGREQGYLPGTIDEKIAPYMRPVQDTILSLQGFNFNYTFENVLKKDNKKEGVLEILPLATLRGANLVATGIFDECQNEDVSSIQGYVSRFQTPGSKVILLGSFKQIDLLQNRRNLENCGLYHILHAFRGWEKYSHIHLVDNMRGELAREIDKRLPYRF
jgi:predicted ribonuclease YlaK